MICASCYNIPKRMTFIDEWYRVEESRQTVIGSLSKHDVDGSESVIWKCNFAFLQSFFTYFKVIILEKCVQAILEIGPSAWDIRGHLMLTSSTQLQNRSFHGVERTRNSSKWQKMKNARAKRAKILFFIVKYANLTGFCCRRRRGCLSSLITRKRDWLTKSVRRRKWQLQFEKYKFDIFSLKV